MRLHNKILKVGYHDQQTKKF